MSPSSSPGQESLRPLGPTPIRERALPPDVLRGVALLGVLLINLDSFRGATFRYLLERRPYPGWANHLVDLLRFSLFQGKSVCLLSMLFGAGLALQLERAEAAGRSFQGVATRRLVALFLLGVLHTFLLWNGDILADYAIVGALSLLFIRRTSRTLTIWAVVLLLAVPAVSLARRLLLGAPTPVLARLARESVEGYGRGGYAEVFSYRLREFALMEPLLVPTWLLFLACFLIGFLLARRGVLLRPAEHRRAVRRLARWALVGGLAGNLALVLVNDRWGVGLGAASRAALGAGRMLLYPTLALGYVAAVLLLLESPVWRRWLQPFAAVGRMALSTYLSQSLLLSFVFYGYGLGLFGKVNTVQATALGLVLFGLQAVACRWWLWHFGHGPAERLWRAMTYPRPRGHLGDRGDRGTRLS